MFNIHTFAHIYICHTNALIHCQRRYLSFRIRILYALADWVAAWLTVTIRMREYMRENNKQTHTQKNIEITASYTQIGQHNQTKQVPTHSKIKRSYILSWPSSRIVYHAQSCTTNMRKMPEDTQCAKNTAALSFTADDNFQVIPFFTKIIGAHRIHIHTHTL